MNPRGWLCELQKGPNNHRFYNFAHFRKNIKANLFQQQKNLVTLTVSLDLQISKSTQNAALLVIYASSSGQNKFCTLA